MPKDYIRFKLTREYATEVSDASGMQFLDIPYRYWYEEILQKLKIDRTLFRTLYESPQITGKVHIKAI